MKSVQGTKAWFQMLVLLVGGLSLANAQVNSCEPLRPLRGSLSQYKDRGNRCEGLYEADFGAKSLALVSFTLGEIAYPLRSGTKLELTDPGKSGTIHVRAVAKPANVAYEMDAVLGAGSTLVWPVDDVLLPEGLNARQVGVFAWRDESTHQIFVPIRVGVSGAKPPPSPGAVLAIRPSFDVQVVKWRLASATSWVCAVPGPWLDAVQSSVDAGQTISITLPPIAGPHCLDVAAQGSGTDWVPISLRLDVPRL